MIAPPGVRIESVVTDVFVWVAVELLRAGARQDADLCAGSASVFGRVGSGEDLNFLGGVDVGRAQAGAIGARARRRRAVIRNQVLRVARAVEVGRALAELERETGGVAGAGGRGGRAATHRVSPAR